MNSLKHVCFDLIFILSQANYDYLVFTHVENTCVNAFEPCLIIMFVFD